MPTLEEARQTLTHTSERELLAWHALDGYVLPSGHTLHLHHYGCGKPALSCTDPLGAPYCVLTHNLPDELGEGEFHVRAEVAESAKDILDQMQHLGLVYPSGRWVSAGWNPEYAQVWCHHLVQPVD